MRQDKKLMLGMAILFLITFIFFGTLVTTEKLAPYYTNKIKERFENYIKENYKDENNNLKIGKISYKNQQYKAKVSNRNNKDLYFTITYQNKEIKDTYKKDYLEGKTLLNKLEKNLEEKIKENTNQSVSISIPLPLNEYTNKIQENLINNNLENTKIYDIEFTINSNIETTDIVNKMEEIVTELSSMNIYPNHYNITIKNKKSKLTINSLTNNTIEKTTLTQIISDIITNNDSDIIKINNISYQYTNKGE